MKLRLRSFETKETVKIEVPTPFSLLQLKQLLCQTLPSPSSSPSSIHLSLNRKDELYTSSSPELDSLQSLGITSGDLIFFSFYQSSFASHQTHHQPMPPNPLNSRETLTSHPVSQKLQNPGSESNTQNEKTIDLNTQKENSLIPNPNSENQETPVSESEKTYDLNTQKEKNLNFDTKIPENLDYMEVDDDDDDDGSVVEVIGKSFCVPGFMRKVFTEELNDDSGFDHKLLVIAIHSVLLESGFVGFDPVSNQEVRGFQFPNKWPSLAFNMSLRYTLPGIITKMNAGVDEIETVVLKFQSLGNFFTVYGCLANGTGMHSVRLDENRLVPFLNVVWANCGSVDEIRDQNGSLSASPEQEIFMFWRTVKDRLALPLSIDLCYKAGLQLPPCFMQIPSEIKLTILELLSGDEVAKVACVCSELRYLASSDDLWKQKFGEEFGDSVKSVGGGHWKEKFAMFWERRQRRMRMRGMAYTTGLYRMDSNSFIGHRFPRTRGGPRDVWPHVVCSLFPVKQRDRACFRSWNHMRHCNLGGLDE